MPANWILKTEPSTYGFHDLEREMTATWDGVRNPVAIRNLAEMEPGDRLIIYHTGDEKACVGLASVAKAAYADPKAKDPKLLVIDLTAGKRLAHPVTLAAIKADPLFADCALVRQPRLSVVRATDAQYQQLIAMSQS